jgi:dihydropteroate synthase
MAILNATPDSFSGDGLGADPEAVRARAQQAAAEGADILDLGAESTRPGAARVPEEEELARVLAVLPALVEATDLPISIDTSKPRVADRALALGAVVLNDVSGLADPDLAAVAAAHGAYLVLTHNGWTTGRRSADPVDAVAQTLEGLVDQATRAGVAADRLLLDPGLGFGKPAQDSLALLRGLGVIAERLAPYPILVGPSRKGFIGKVLGGLAPDDRLEGTLACVAVACLAGVSVVRAHDVRASVRAARMAWAIRGAPRGVTPSRR